MNENVFSIISSHNKKISTKKEDDVLTCKCKDKTNCLLDGQWETQSVIYKCEVTTENLPKKVYIGLTEREFKSRFKQSFNNEKYKKSTTLSTYVWSLKANNILPSFKWSVVKKAKPYSNTTNSCPLCLQEKLEILCYKNNSKNCLTKYLKMSLLVPLSRVFFFKLIILSSLNCSCRAL